MQPIKSRKHAPSRFNQHVSAALATMLLPIAAGAAEATPARLRRRRQRPRLDSPSHRPPGKRFQGRARVLAQVHGKAGRHGPVGAGHQEGTDRAARRPDAHRSAAQHARRRRLLPRRERQHEYRRRDLHARLRYLGQHFCRRRARRRLGLARRLQPGTDRRRQRPGRHRQRPRRTDRLGQPGVEKSGDGGRRFRLAHGRQRVAKARHRRRQQGPECRTRHRPAPERDGAGRRPPGARRGQGQALGRRPEPGLRPERPDARGARLPARRPGQHPRRRRADGRPARLHQPGPHPPLHHRCRAGRPAQLLRFEQRLRQGESRHGHRARRARLRARLQAAQHHALRPHQPGLPADRLHGFQRQPAHAQPGRSVDLDPGARHPHREGPGKPHPHQPERAHVAIRYRQPAPHAGDGPGADQRTPDRLRPDGPGHACRAANLYRPEPGGPGHRPGPSAAPAPTTKA